MKNMDIDFWLENPKDSPLSNSLLYNYKDAPPFMFTRLVSLDMIG